MITFTAFDYERSEFRHRPLHTTKMSAMLPFVIHIFCHGVELSALSERGPGLAARASEPDPFGGAYAARSSPEASFRQVFFTLTGAK